MTERQHLLSTTSPTPPVNHHDLASTSASSSITTTTTDQDERSKPNSYGTLSNPDGVVIRFGTADDDDDVDTGSGNEGGRDVYSETTTTTMRTRREEIGEVGQGGAGVGKITPLPWGQLFVICFIRLAEPISFTVIFPFINHQIASLGISPDPVHVGYYAGFVESCFAGTQFMTVLWWGRMSDQWGRRPVILTGIAGVMISTLSFGFSRTFAWMLVSRCINGAINGNVAALKSGTLAIGIRECNDIVADRNLVITYMIKVVGEITDETNAASAFALLPLFWAVGAIIGPALGGYLPEPAKRFPKLFGGVWLWEEYPFLLPCLVASGITALGWIGGLLFLDETLESKVNARKRLPLVQAEADLRTVDETGQVVPRSSASTLTGDDPAEEIAKPAPPTLMAVLRDDVVGRTLLSYAALALIAVSHDAIWVLWLFTPLGSGGLGFSTARIGTMLSLYGALSVIVQLALFPPIQRRLGSVIFFRMFLCGYGIVCAAAVLVNRIAIYRAPEGSVSAADDHVVLGLVASIVVLKALSNTCFSCISLLVNSSAADRASLGTVNGLAQMAASSARALGPALINSIFAFGVSRHVLNAELAWYILFAMSLVSSAISMTVKDGAAERRRRATIQGQ